MRLACISWSPLFASPITRPLLLTKSPLRFIYDGGNL
jgi:hypothetical protein